METFRHSFGGWDTWRPSDTACGWEVLESVCSTPEGNMCTSGKNTAVPSTLDQRLFKGKMEAV